MNEYQLCDLYRVIHSIDVSRGHAEYLLNVSKILDTGYAICGAAESSETIYIPTSDRGFMCVTKV